MTDFLIKQGRIQRMVNIEKYIVTQLGIQKYASYG